MTQRYEYVTWLTEHTGHDGFDCYQAAEETFREQFEPRGWRVCGMAGCVERAGVHGAPSRGATVTLHRLATASEHRASARYTQRLALAAFLERDYARSERLTAEAREMRRDGERLRRLTAARAAQT